MNVRRAANDRLTANRRLFLAAYVGLGLLSMFIYLNQVNISFVAVAGARSGLGVIFVAVPAILPYVIAGAYAWRLISERRLGLGLFLIATTVGTVMAGLLITGAFDVRLDVVEVIFGYVVGQTSLYGLAAEFLLRIEWP